MQQQQQNYMQPLMQQPQQQQPNPNQHQHQTLYAYGEHEDIQGVVHLVLPPGKKFESLGIKIQFVGRVDMVRAYYIFCYVTALHCIFRYISNIGEQDLLH